MKTITLKLHQDGQVFTLDPNDAFSVISENNIREVELYQYIETLCEYLNYPLFKNPDMAFDDGKEYYLSGWICGYETAKHYIVGYDRSSIRCRGYRILIPKMPYMENA